MFRKRKGRRGKKREGKEGI